jgi:HSP20 family protein
MAREEMPQRAERGVATRQYQDPFSMLDAMFERMQREFFGASLLSAFSPTGAGEERERGALTRVPRVQMHDRGDAIEITAELPGIDGKDIKVECQDDVLTIRGETRSQDEREGARSEHYASFYRQIPLPEGVDTEHGRASYRNGVLTLHFPRRTRRESAREIPVSTEQQQLESGGKNAKGKAA